MNTINNTTDPVAGETILMSGRTTNGEIIGHLATVGEIKEQYVPFAGPNAGKVTALTFVEKDTGVIWRVWDNGFRLVQHDSEWLKNPVAESIIEYCLGHEYRWRIAPLGSNYGPGVVLDMHETLLILAKAGVGIKTTAQHLRLRDELDRSLANREMLRDLLEEDVQVHFENQRRLALESRRRYPVARIQSAPFSDKDKDRAMAMAFRQVISAMHHDQKDEFKDVHEA